MLNILKKKMTLITDIFPKLRTPKNLVRSMPKKPRLRGSFLKQHLKSSLSDEYFQKKYDPHS